MVVPEVRAVFRVKPCLTIPGGAGFPVGEGLLRRRVRPQKCVVDCAVVSPTQGPLIPPPCVTRLFDPHVVTPRSDQSHIPTTLPRSVRVRASWSVSLRTDVIKILTPVLSLTFVFSLDFYTCIQRPFHCYPQFSWIATPLPSFGSCPFLPFGLLAPFESRSLFLTTSRA